MILHYLSIFFLILGLIYIIWEKLSSKKNNNFPKSKITKQPVFAILIPARNESKVIEGLFQSLIAQTYKVFPKDIYVIVESSEDLTVQIAQKYGITVVVRKHLDLRSKGYALDEGVKFIKNNVQKKYDAYFIFDADNVLENNFLEEMVKTYQEGYDVAVGYRNCKNGNDSITAACSTLTFSMINTLKNEKKLTTGEMITISGTGFYVKGEWIDKWDGYPFHSLTEDYELTLYATYHDFTSFYNKKAVFYDEQPIHYHDTVPQRIRWIRGYLNNWFTSLKKFRKLIFKNNCNVGSYINAYVGIKPYLCFILSYLLEMIVTIILIFNGSFGLVYRLFYFLLVLFLPYIVLFLFTLLMIIKEKENGLKLNLKMKIKALFLNPFYLFTYIPCALKAFLKKDITWSPVRHGQTK